MIDAMLYLYVGFVLCLVLFGSLASSKTPFSASPTTHHAHSTVVITSAASTQTINDELSTKSRGAEPKSTEKAPQTRTLPNHASRSISTVTAVATSVKTDIASSVAPSHAEVGDDRCEVLVGASLCKKYVANRTVFFDGRLQQQETVKYIDFILDQIQQFASSLRDRCKGILEEFVCRYVLTNCTVTSNSSQDISIAVLCKESCETTFQRIRFCSPQFVSILGSVGGFISTYNGTSPKHLSLKQLECNELDTKERSNYTCLTINPLTGKVL